MFQACSSFRSVPSKMGQVGHSHGIRSFPGGDRGNRLFECSGGSLEFCSKRVIQDGQRYRVGIGYDFIPGWDRIG